MEPTLEERYWGARKDAISEFGPQIDSDNRASIEYAHLAIRSSIILNGGALFVLPAYVGNVVGKVDVNNEILIFAAASFALGILLAVICAFVAYLNFGLHSDEHQYEFHLRLNEIEEHYDASNKIRLAAARRGRDDDTKRKISSVRKNIDLTWKIGVTFGILSYFSFMVGCILGGQVMLDGI